jgi:hypothetical protein
MSDVPSENNNIRGIKNRAATFCFEKKKRKEKEII